MMSIEAVSQSQEYYDRSGAVSEQVRVRIRHTGKDDEKKHEIVRDKERIHIHGFGLESGGGDDEWYGLEKHRSIPDDVSSTTTTS